MAVEGRRVVDAALRLHAVALSGLEHGRNNRVPIALGVSHMSFIRTRAQGSVFVQQCVPLIAIVIVPLHRNGGASADRVSQASGKDSVDFPRRNLCLSIRTRCSRPGNDWRLGHRYRTERWRLSKTEKRVIVLHT